MNNIKTKYLKGATPIDVNEMKGLIPDYITTQEELNSLEQENITEAKKWIYSKFPSDILNRTFNCNLHKKMLDQVWKWAGTFRTTDKNIGVNPEQIGISLEELFKNTKYWIENNTYEWDELASRFHHKLVFIHCFPNGNGRHARLMTDLLLKLNNKEPFTWGGKSSQSSIQVESKVRNSYIESLKKADNNSFSELIDFVKS